MVDAGRIAEAHVLSPERRVLRAQLSVRGALVETRAQYVTTIRGLARAAGVLLPTCDTENFVRKLDGLAMDEATRALVAPLVAMLGTLETELARVETSGRPGREGSRPSTLRDSAWRGADCRRDLRLGDRRRQALQECACRGSLPRAGAQRVDDGRSPQAPPGRDHQARQPHGARDAHPGLVDDLSIARSHRPAQELGRAPRDQAPQAGGRRGARAQAGRCGGPCGATVLSTIRRATPNNPSKAYARRSAGKWDALKLSNEPPRSSDAWRQTARARPPNLRRRGCCRSPTVPLLRCALRAR